MNTQNDIIRKSIYKTHKAKPKSIKMNEVFQTKNNKVIFKNQNSIRTIINDKQQDELEKLIKRHR